ncbi:MAG: hypothetical protein M1818_000278 [Claussenomyces sp. TS43310]|nr:MAG: hypothetical protein M1818_000278 [Claussenomyces sp. TS43310]
MALPSRTLKDLPNDGDDDEDEDEDEDEDDAGQVAAVPVFPSGRTANIGPCTANLSMAHHLLDAVRLAGQVSLLLRR